MSKTTPTTPPPLSKGDKVYAIAFLWEGSYLFLSEIFTDGQVAEILPSGDPSRPVFKIQGTNSATGNKIDLHFYADEEYIPRVLSSDDKGLTSVVACFGRDYDTVLRAAEDYWGNEYEKAGVSAILLQKLRKTRSKLFKKQHKYELKIAKKLRKEKKKAVKAEFLAAWKEQMEQAPREEEEQDEIRGTWVEIPDDEERDRDRDHFLFMSVMAFLFLVATAIILLVMAW